MYTSYYGLREEPFRLTPDPRFLHLAEPHRATLTRLVQGILLRKGLMVLTGAIGTGKTTLLHTTLQLLSAPKLQKTPIASAFLLNPTLSREELLEAILEEFEVTCLSNSKPRRLAALHQMLLDTQQRSGTAVLLIDEAHLLSHELLEEIRLLSNTDTYREKPLQIILCGQLEFLTMLDRPELSALKQRIAVRCQLRALSQTETRAYVAERLHAAGLGGSSPFPTHSLEEIYLYTQGVPRLINLMCDGCLTVGAATHRKHVGLDIVAETAATLGLTRMTPAAPPRSSLRESEQEDQVSRSTVDILIEAMKQGRAAAQE